MPEPLFNKVACQACNFIKKEYLLRTPSKNTFSYSTPSVNTLTMHIAVIPFFPIRITYHTFYENVKELAWRIISCLHLMTGDMSLVKIMQGKFSIGHSGNFEINVRSIRSQMVFKIGVLKNFSGISF